MHRSRWKVPYVNPIFLGQKFFNLLSFNTFKRNSLITAKFLGKRLRVHNGKRLISFIVQRNMIGKSLGEFSVTKFLGSERIRSMLKKIKAKKKRKKK